MKKIPKTILNRINEINNLIPAVNNLANFASTYAGGTIEFYIEIKPILVLNQFVKIESESLGNSNFLNKEKFNTNKIGQFDENGLIDLKYSLSIILQAFKKAIKKENMSKKIELRLCSNCKNPMAEGYVINGGENYFCGDTCLHENHMQKDYEQMHYENEEENYYTEWESEILEND